MKVPCAPANMRGERLERAFLGRSSSWSWRLKFPAWPTDPTRVMEGVGGSLARLGFPCARVSFGSSPSELRGCPPTAFRWSVARAWGGKLGRATGRAIQGHFYGAFRHFLRGLRGGSAFPPAPFRGRFRQGGDDPVAAQRRWSRVLRPTARRSVTCPPLFPSGAFGLDQPHGPSGWPFCQHSSRPAGRHVSV